MNTYVQDAPHQERLESQVQLILAALIRGEEVTHLTASQRFGCARLASRINDIKKMGYNVVTEIVKGSNGQRYGSYRLAHREKEQIPMFVMPKGK